MGIRGSLFDKYSYSNEIKSKIELANPCALDSNGNPVLPENA